MNGLVVYLFLFHTMFISIILPKVETVIDKIIEEARTGEIGDGKIFCKNSNSLLTISNNEIL